MTVGLAGLSITDLTSRESTHYPLTMQAMIGHELGLRVEYDTDVFDASNHENPDATIPAVAGRHDC